MPSPPDGRASDLDDLLPDLGMADVLQQRPQGIGSVSHAVRIALAVTVSYVVAEAVSQSAFGLFAPVTTLLVVQASPWTTLGVSIQRILGTGIGVAVASVYVNVVGITWWSFLGGVLVALLVARSLPWSLGGQLQIPVAVVFVLALGPGTIQQDIWRVLDVVIGGVVGLAAVFVFPSRPSPAAFEDALRAFRDAILDTLRSVGAESARPDLVLPADASHEYVAPSRRLRERAGTARTALLRLLEGSALNLRAGEVPAELEARAQRLRRLSGIAVQVRGIVGAANRTYHRSATEPGLTGSELDRLITQVADLLESALGGPADPVGSGDRRGIETRSTAVADELRSAADRIAAGREQVGDVLASVSMLGRLDHVRMQAVDFPPWGDAPVGP